MFIYCSFVTAALSGDWVWEVLVQLSKEKCAKANIEIVIWMDHSNKDVIMINQITWFVSGQKMKKENKLINKNKMLNYSVTEKREVLSV